MSLVQPPLTEEQLAAETVEVIINPQQPFRSVTIFHSEEARHWYEHRNDPVAQPDGEDAADERPPRGRVARRNWERRRAERAAQRQQQVAPIQVMGANVAPQPARQEPIRQEVREEVPVARAQRPEPVAVVLPQPVLGGDWPPSDALRMDYFWRLIAGWNWHNASEGPNNGRKIRDTVAGWTPGYRKIFMEIYHATANVMTESFRNDVNEDGQDMFTRNNQFADEEVNKVVSHFIGLGQDIYGNMLQDHAFAQILIESGECESLDAHMQDMKIPLYGANGAPVARANAPQMLEEPSDESNHDEDSE